MKCKLVGKKNGGDKLLFTQQFSTCSRHNEITFVSRPPASTPLWTATHIQVIRTSAAATQKGSSHRNVAVIYGPLLRRAEEGGAHIRAMTGDGGGGVI